MATLLCLVGACAGPAPTKGAPGGEGGSEEPGAGGTGGVSSRGSGGAGTGGKGGGAPAPDAAAETVEAGPGLAPDASPDQAPDVATASDSGITSDDGGTPSYQGQVPIYYGPEVGPIVQMQCPGDPTEGWTEYKDSFHVEHPYDVPTNTRFRIAGGVYDFWVFPNDKPHSVTAQGKNPRTEAAYGGTYDKMTVPGSDGRGHFVSGMRLYSADIRIESNAVNSAFMQIHTTTTGGGPIGIRLHSNSDIVNNGKLTVVHGSDYPGGLVDKWFNYKASLNADTLEVKIYLNNCLKSTYKGDRGDGNFYFKNGVYFCSASGGCRTHYKNIHLYTK